MRKLLWKVKPKAQMDPGSSLCQVTRGWGGGGGARHGQGLGAYLIFSLCFANGAWKLLYKEDGPCPGFFSDWTGTKTQCHLAFSQTSERPLLPLNTSTFGTPLCSFMCICSAPAEWSLQAVSLAFFSPVSLTSSRCFNSSASSSLFLNATVPWDRRSSFEDPNILFSKIKLWGWNPLSLHQDQSYPYGF